MLPVTNFLYFLRNMHKQSKNWPGVQYPLKAFLFNKFKSSSWICNATVLLVRHTCVLSTDSPET